MTIHSEIYSRLSGYSGLTALVSTRIYPNLAPQNVTYPYVTFRQVSAVRESGFGADIDIIRTRIQLDAFAETHLSSRNIAAQIIAALQRWSNPSGTPEVIDVQIDNDMDQFEIDPVLHHAIVDIITYHR